ncbi:imelysin family protein [Pollutimonas harenae]|uniref:Imelysin family protein n=1 Tax=Pollutimonas harenae TaxID=657015 RepID=A0A853H1X2_9BURK|nr:imelysin family protein [Pollutimonas harenae]NYT85235.1 imelysin family protein [Pollutimonas harenae]TEA72395.1 aminopeptidase [Pollutimonas harenae]
MPDYTKNSIGRMHGAAWRFTTLGIGFLLAAGIARAGELPADLGSRLAQGYIAPAMQSFHRSAGQLHTGLQAWCSSPTEQGAQEIKDKFKNVVMAWSGIEFLRFGPLIAEHRFERVYFWPDPRGRTSRQVKKLLADPAGVPAAQALSKHSVAVQGLPALEYTLYRDSGLLASQGGDSFSSECAYAVSISENLVAIGSELGSAWGKGGDYAQKFSQPSPENSLYRSTDEIAHEAIKALSSGLQFARDVKLLPMLGDDISRAKYQRAPFWRSGLTAPSMAAGVDGMLRFYQAGGYQYKADDAWVQASTTDELIRVRDNFNSVNADIKQVASSEETYRQFKLAALMIKNAKGLVDENVAPALGVRIGFNALDGD